MKPVAMEFISNATLHVPLHLDGIGPIPTSLKLSDSSQTHALKNKEEGKWPRVDNKENYQWSGHD